MPPTLRYLKSLLRRKRVHDFWHPFLPTHKVIPKLLLGKWIKVVSAYGVGGDPKKSAETYPVSFPQFSITPKDTSIFVSKIKTQIGSQPRFHAVSAYSIRRYEGTKVDLDACETFGNKKGTLLPPPK